MHTMRMAAPAKVHVVLVVLTLTRIIIKSPWSQDRLQSLCLELRNTPGQKNTNKPKVVHKYITADAIHASTRNIQK